MRNYLNIKILILAIGVVLIYSCDRSPSIEWEKKISWEVLQEAMDIKQTNDGGYIILGKNGFKPTLIKINSKGNTEWVKEFADYNNKLPKVIQQTNDGGYIVVGSQGYGLDQNFWVSKLDKTADVIWSKEYDDGGNREEIIAIECIEDGSYIIAGERLDVIDNIYSSDYWIARIDNNGALSWSKVIGGSSMDIPMMMSKTKNGNFIIEGKTLSEDGDVAGKMIKNSTKEIDAWRKQIEFPDIWSIDINDNGEIINSKRKDFYPFQEKKITLTTDRTYLLAGEKWVGNTNGSVNLLLEKRDINLNLIWSKIIDGPGKDESLAIQQTSEGGYIVLATVYHNDNFKTWLIKLSSD